jgi:Uma2 family endonuclease
MSTTLVSLQEYLDTSYSPDREYVDGVVVERQEGERPHSAVQSNLNHFLRIRCPNLYSWPEQRIRTTGTRARIPDICLTLDDPGVDVFDAPPFLCIEILSRDDRAVDLLEKLDEYTAMGVPHIWVIDPRARQAFTYAASSLQRVTGSSLTAGDISIPFDEVFFRL